MSRRIKYYSQLDSGIKKDVKKELASSNSVMDIQMKGESYKALLLSFENDEWLIIIDDHTMLRKSGSNNDLDNDEDIDFDDETDSDDSRFELEDKEE
jgi:hypothetical protein